MSNLFKYTKRVLTSVLAAALVVTAIPSTAFGAEIVDEDIEVVTLQEDAQESEVTEAGAVEEDAFTVDGASGEEVIEEEEQEPDQYTGDGELTLKNYYNAKAGLFTISGDTATPLAKTDDDSSKVPFDSELGLTIYVVPEIGYTLVDGTDNLGAVKEIAGSFQYTGEAAVTDMSDAYTITRGISLPNVAWFGYDFSNVQRIEFNTTSGIAGAFKAYKEKASDLAAKPTLSVELKGTKGADATEAGKINVKLQKADGTTSSFGNATYGEVYGGTDGKPLAGATDDWDNTTVSVILSNSEGKTGANYEEYALASAKNDNMMTKSTTGAGGANAYFVDGSHNVWISLLGIEHAYEVAATDNSYSLSVVLKTEANTNIHTLTTETSDYYTLTGTDITAGKVEKGSSTDYHYFTAALGAAGKIGTSTIKITDVYYQVGDNDPKKAHALTSADVSGTHSGKTAVNTTTGVGDYLILGDEFTADTVIWAEVAQNITVNITDATWMDGATAKSAVAVTNTYSSSTAVNFAEDDIAPFSKNATIVMNDDKFTFTAVPKTGYKIDSVKARIYDIKHANYSDFTLTNLGNGKYETSALNTNAEIFVKTSKVDSQYQVKTAGNYTSNAVFAGNATGATFAAGGTLDAIAGEDYVFTITAKPGSYVDTVKYTMGMDSTEHTLTATPDRQGVSKYTIPNVTGAITVAATFTNEKSARVERIANSYATVNVTGDGELKYVADPTTGAYSATYNDYIIADGRHPLAFTVATKENATVDKVYYEVATAGSAPSNLSGSPIEITPVGETYQIPASVLTAATGSNTIYIIVTTKKEITETAAGSGFKVEWAGTVKPNRKEDIAKSGKFQLIGGGTDAKKTLASATLKTAAGLDGLDIAATDTVTATFKTTDGKVISGTPTYALGKTTTTEKVADISGATITSFTRYGDDKITATLESAAAAFPHKIKYTAELPLEVTALNTLYDESKLALAFTVTDGTGATADTVAKAGLTTTEGKIRAISSTSDANDVVTLAPQYTDKNKAVKTLVHSVSSTESIIKGITWKATSGDFTYSTSKLDPEFVVYKSNTPATTMGSATENDTASIATAKSKQDIDVTATIEYLDGSKDALAGKVSVIDAARGYFAIPTVTVGDAKDYNPVSVDIEAKAGGLNTATISYDVYRVDAYTNAIASGITTGNLMALDEDDIETLENAQSIKKVETGITFGAMSKAPSTDASMTVAGSNPYTVTAVKKGTGVGLTPSIVVNGMTVAASPLFATVAGELTGYTVTLNTDDSSNTAQVDGGLTYTAPLLNDNAAWLSRTPVGKTLGAKTVTAYVYEGVANGTTLVLPTEADFNIKTFKPQVKLWAWEVSGSALTTYVEPGGKYTINTGMADTTFTPIWADRYVDCSTGHAAGVSVLNSASNALLGNSAVLTIAKGYNVPVTIGFYELDMDESPSAAPVYKADPKYVTTGMSLTGNEAATSYLTLTDNKISAVNNVLGDNPVVTIKYTENAGADNEAVYVPNNLPKVTSAVGGYNPVEAGNIVVTVQSTPTEYAVTADAITLERTQTKSAEFTIEAGTAKTKKYKATAADNIADVKVISDNESIVEGEYDATNSDASHNYVALTGNANGTTTVKIQITDKFGVVKESDPISVTVSDPTKEIVAVSSASATNDELDPTYGFTVIPWSNTKSPSTISAGDVAAELQTMTFKIKESNALLNKAKADWTVTNTTDNDVVKTGLRAIDASKDNSNFATTDEITKAQKDFHDGVKLSGTNGEVTIWPSTDFGTGEITVTWEENAKSSYTRVVPVTSYFAFKYKVDDNVGTPTTKKFTTYNGTTEKKADFTQKVIYNGSASYTVPDSDMIVASWDDEGKKEFLGWKAFATDGTYAAVDPTYASATSADFAAGEAITFKKTELASKVLYAQFAEPQVAVTGLPESITVTDETISSTTAAGTDAKAYIIDVAPKTSMVDVTIDADDSGLITLDGSDTEKSTAVSRTLYNTPGVPPTGQTVTFKNTVATNPSVTTRTHTFTVGMKAGTVGETKLVVRYGTETKKIPVYVNGEYVFTAASGTTPAVYHYMENGKDLVSGMRVVAGKEHYYADSKKITEGVVTIDGGKMVLIVNGDRITKAGERAVGSDKYYVGNDGFVKVDEKFNGLTTGDANKTYYAGKDGKLVANQLVEISGKTYYFQADATMAKAPSTANKFAKVGDYYVNADGEVAKSGLFVVDGINRLFRENGTIVSYAESDVVDGKITVNGVIYVIDKDTNEAKPDHTDHKWKFNNFVWSADGKTATATFTCEVGGESADAVVAMSSETKGKDAAAITRYTAKVTKDPDGKAVSYTDYSYLKADGTKGTKADWNKVAGGSDETESEPEQSDVASYQSFNLFYNDVEIPVPGLQDALSNEGAKMSGKWTSFFTVADGSDTVAVSSSADAKKAANASNSLVVVDYTGGQFAYQLPVYYQKAALKLTSTSGTVKQGVETTLKTTVTEKKSTGLYEAMDLDDDDIKSYTGSVVKYAAGSETGEIEITAKAKTNGKFTIQKANWREALTVSYAVKESKNDVIEGPKEVIFNTTSDTKEYEFTITKNGQALDSDNTVTVELPKKWSDSGVTGIEAGTLTDGDIKLELTGSPKKGTYSVVFKSGSGKFTLKVKVDNTAKANAIKLKVQTKMNLTTGQKMVVVPTLKNIGGSIDDVEIKLTGSPFTATYLKEKNQIIVSANGLVPVTAGKNSTTFTVTVDGEEIEVPLNNFQVEAKKPTVKLATVTLPKTKVQSSDGADGSTNVLSTYKQGGKVFGVDPVKVVFMNGKNAAAESKDHAGWYEVDTKNGILAQYDAAEGKILVHAQNSAGKGGTVKAEFYFNGQAKPITKSFTVKAK